LCGFFLYGHSAIWPEQVVNRGPIIAASQVPIRISEEKKDRPVPVVYGSPWRECVIGHYAVTRDCSDSAGTVGIAVYKIMEIYESKVEGEYDVNTFRGKELICHVNNHKINCVKNGKWRLLRELSVESTVNNWHVISYFARFKTGDHLPRTAVDDIVLVHSREVVFVD
jgi:hypothetical protein